jgi:pimeloyl-ACP methyl ester carboxylesterase
MRGATPSSREYRAAPYFFKSLSENGWDIFGGMMPRGLPSIATEYVAPAGAFMLRRAEELKREGYKRVVLAGHSLGAWSASRVSENAGAPFEAILLSAPAVFGTRISPFTGGPNPTYQLNLTELGPLFMKVKKPTFLVVPDDRDYDPDPAARGAIAEKIFTQAKLEHVVLTKPPGFSGHIAAWLPIFDYAYGKCIQRFLESPSSDACQVPALSNADFRSIVRLDQVTGADDKRITSGEPLVGKKYIVYSLQSEADKPNVRELTYLSANQRQSLEIDSSPREKIAFRDGLHCAGTKCSILVRWTENQLLEFDAKSRNVSAWWAEE